VSVSERGRGLKVSVNAQATGATRVRIGSKSDYACWGQAKMNDGCQRKRAGEAALGGRGCAFERGRSPALAGFTHTFSASRVRALHFGLARRCATHAGTGARSSRRITGSAVIGLCLFNMSAAQSPVWSFCAMP
jgi:hypothetical protein